MPNNRKWNNPTSIISFRSQHILPEYGQWVGMINRCNTKPNKGGKNQTYLGCTFSEDWSSYNNYIEWARNQIGFLNRDANGSVWQLDKDLLVKGNKRYSPEVCVFIPNSINCLFHKTEKVSGDLPVGVYLEKCSGKYKAQISLPAGRKTLGRFVYPEAAYRKYKEAKEHFAKQLAKDFEYSVDPRVINLLQSYTLPDF